MPVRAVIAYQLDPARGMHVLGTYPVDPIISPATLIQAYTNHQVDPREPFMAFSVGDTVNIASYRLGGPDDLHVMLVLGPNEDAMIFEPVLAGLVLDDVTPRDARGVQALLVTAWRRVASQPGGEVAPT